MYRGGSGTLDNLTPRAVDLEGDGAPGLSTWQTAEQALASSGKAQMIDLDQLPSDLQAIEEVASLLCCKSERLATRLFWPC